MEEEEAEEEDEEEEAIQNITINNNPVPEY